MSLEELRGANMHLIPKKKATANSSSFFQTSTTSVEKDGKVIISYNLIIIKTGSTIGMASGVH